MADYSQTCFFVTGRKEGSFRVKPGDKSRDVPAFVSLTNFILILTPVAPQRSCGGTGLTGIRISTLSTFIHSGCGACRETFAKYHGIDCRSFLSERNATNPAHRASVYSSLTQSMRVCVRACDCIRYWCICSRLDEISVSPIYRRCRVIRNLKFRRRSAVSDMLRVVHTCHPQRTCARYSLKVLALTCSSAYGKQYLIEFSFPIKFGEDPRISCSNLVILHIFLCFEDRKKKKRKIR